MRNILFDPARDVSRELRDSARRAAAQIARQAAAQAERQRHEVTRDGGAAAMKTRRGGGSLRRDGARRSVFQRATQPCADDTRYAMVHASSGDKPSLRCLSPGDARRMRKRCEIQRRDAHGAAAAAQRDARVQAVRAWRSAVCRGCRFPPRACRRALPFRRCHVITSPPARRASPPSR